VSHILVSGLINIETTTRIDGFPIAYTPVRYPFFGVNSTVSGVGYNVAKALTTLGSPVRLASLIGRDMQAQLVYTQLKADGIPHGFVIQELEQTPCSVILYDGDGRRMINVDLKDIQERPYPPVLFEGAAHDVDLAVLCNINFSRPMLAAMRERGIPIATDVHAISDLDSDYDGPFMAAADILFMSHEHLPCAPESWIRRLWDRYGTQIAVIGLGAEGALLAVRADGAIERVPAVTTRPVVNTIGAGDALFASFIHAYRQTGDPYRAIRQAVVFASYKIGEAGAAQGFLDTEGLAHWVAQVAIS
jgi:sugar/nucleoside kinase (ribokinase family)